MEAIHPSQFVSPEVTNALPSGKAVTVGYHRGNDMGVAAVQVCVTGSNNLATGSPRWAPFACPPAHRTLPSGNSACPEQKRLSLEVTGMKVLVAGSQTLTLYPP